jgi:hypothetical protein
MGSVDRNAALKTVRRDESIIRNRFTECPHCKTRNFKIKKTIDVGRCRKCRDSYKIITIYLKVGGTAKSIAKNELSSHETSLPSWQSPSDSALFASAGQDRSTFSNSNFAWGTEERRDESETTTSQ